MGNTTKIEWANSTWTPIRARVKKDAAEIAASKGWTSLRVIPGKVGPHCERVSPGCGGPNGEGGCYSEANNMRCLPSNGTGLPFDRRSRELVDIFVDEKILQNPLRWRKPRTIFVCSQTDLFGDFVTDEMIDRVFAVMMLCDSTRSRAVYKGVHQFVVLTKRAKRMASYMNDPETRFRIGSEITNIVITGYRPHKGGCDWHECTPWPPENLVLGVSVEGRNYLHRIDDLRATPAVCRMVSFEPLLGDLGEFDAKGIDWAIIGGESGRNARSCNVRWLISAAGTCWSAGAAVLVKQLGSAPVLEADEHRLLDLFPEHVKRRCIDGRLSLRHPKGGDPAEWCPGLRHREFPTLVASTMGGGR